ncbi:hypothetical protein GCM10009111_24660 [Colwellia asteriadis]|uniref:PilZ domain-containing protein n=1 Tax=Colwellia asteriadis TaxID=517723 RepID=A0ABP3WL93_9GAMM
MNTKTLEQKLAQYHEFFAIAHNFTLNIHPLTTDVSSFDDFLSNMPTPFKLASDVTTVDQSALRPLQALNSVSAQLVDFLNLQAKKIDLLVTYILSQQDDEQHRYQGIEFGGGGIKFNTAECFAIGQMLEVKIFLLDNNCALYCYAEVIEASETDDSAAQENTAESSYQHKAIFHFIREEDREALVRISLHEQAKQLQRLAQHRNQERSN